MKIAGLCALWLSVAGVSASSGPSHPFSVHDMLAMDRLSDPQLSPDGRRVVFVSSVTDLDANKRRTDLWLVGSDGESLRRLTSDPAADVSPRWSPDGSAIWFLSTRSGSQQIWRIAADGGEAQRVTELPLDVTSFALSPDGRRVLLSVEVFPDCDTLDCTKSRLDEIAARKTSARVYERLFVRRWDTWTDGRRAHLFVQLSKGGIPIDVMRGMDADCPSKPFGGSEEYTFTPDSREIVFSARNVGREEAWSTDFDLYRVPADGSLPPRSLTDSNEAWDTQPLFSPDGKTLAYLAMQVPGYESDRFRIVIRQWPDGTPRVLAESWDRSPEGIAWSADGRSILAHADHLGQHALFAVDLSGGAVRTLVEQGKVRAIAAGKDAIVVARDDLHGPTELYRVPAKGGRPSPITRVNADRVAAARMGEIEQFRFAGWNGEEVHAYVVKPADFDPSRKYPVAMLIHGGPQGSFGNEFHYRWNPQAYAGAGYAALMVDFHGSTGYGQAFTDSIGGDWGGKPLVDLQKGLAAALARYSWMDGERVAALGASYGGYMVNWIAGVWPDRFRCLVSHDGNLDERAAYFQTEELWFPEREHGGTPWENPEGYARHNPIDHVGSWKTPMLVLHGGLDFRVVETAGLSTFNALQRRGIPSKLVHFPDENHWVLKPHNSLFWHETVLAWLDQWTR